MSKPRKTFKEIREEIARESGISTDHMPRGDSARLRPARAASNTKKAPKKKRKMTPDQRAQKRDSRRLDRLVCSNPPAPSKPKAHYYVPTLAEIEESERKEQRMGVVWDRRVRNRRRRAG